MPYYKTPPQWRKSEERTQQEHEHYLNVRVGFPYYRTELRCKYCLFEIPGFGPYLMEAHLSKEHNIRINPKRSRKELTKLAKKLAEVEARRKKMYDLIE